MQPDTTIPQTLSHAADEVTLSIGRLLAIAGITLAAFIATHGWYESCHYARHLRHREVVYAGVPVWERDSGCYWGQGQGWEWFGIVGAGVLYCIVGWRRLGGWLVLPQMTCLVVSSGTFLAWLPYSVPLYEPDPWEPAWPCGLQAGIIAAAFISAGVCWFHYATPCRPFTLRAMFVAVLIAAVALTVLRTWLELRYGEHLDQIRAIRAQWAER